VARKLPCVIGDEGAGEASVAGPRGTPAADPWRRVRWVAYGAYFVVLAWIIVQYGVPISRISLALIIMIGLGLTSIGRGWRATVQVVIDWLPFTAVLLLYDRTRRTSWMARSGCSAAPSRPSGCSSSSTTRRTSTGTTR
jgi:hypothetical protein